MIEVHFQVKEEKIEMNAAGETKLLGDSSTD